MNLRLRFPAVLSLIGLLFAVACSQPSRNDKIKARNDAEFDSWVADHSGAFNADDVKELNEARQQLKFKVMHDHPGATSDAANDALYAMIDGHSARDILIAGYELQADREQTNLLNYQPMFEKYERYNKDPTLGDDQKHEVAASLARVTQQMQENRTALERYNKRIAELKQQPATP